MEDPEPDPTLEERRNRYEEKLFNKRERLLERADKADREGDDRIKRADSDAAAIPLGQPILVGHHSEKRDRRFRDRIHNNYSKGYALKDKAGNLRARAASIGTAGVSSDDPDAIVKLEEQLAELEKKHEFNKAINKALRTAIRTGSDEELKKLGFGDASIAQLKKPDYTGKVGIPSYVFSNSSSNMRRIRQRIEALRKAASDKTSEQVHGDIRIVDNVEENRVQVFFPSIPTPEVRKKLKQNGFRWSRTAGAWQRHRSDAALWWARRCCGLE